MAEDILFDDTGGLHEYFDIDYIRSMWEMHLSGVSNFDSKLWALLIFELWHRKFISLKAS